MEHRTALRSTTGRTARTTTRLMAFSLLVALAPLSVASAQAASSSLNVVADWQMNEPAGATAMTDSGPNGINGVIGRAVHTGVSVAGATAYSWPFTSPTAPPAKPERLIKATDSRLNFGTADFAVSFRYRTTHSFGNIVQKGQATTTGGQLKFELPGGKVTCLVRGSIARRAVSTRNTYDDGTWHTVRCARTATGLTMTVSNSGGTILETRKIAGATGDVTNRYPISIAGKTNCDQVTITCDYFTGEVDWVKVEKG